jgi:aspartate/methionine/tyrosine aminotransferase
MNFTERTNWDLTEDDFAAAVRTRRSSGLELLDLTLSNPTDCGFRYDAASLLAPLSHPAALHYRPDALGTVDARNAVAAYYSDAGATVPINRFCLATSTSEAYSFLFRLLCNPGDEVLVARPSYPLFDFIARLDDVRLREYPLLYDPNAALGSGEGWCIDLHALETAITAHTRAIILVHPNNPTGNFASADERSALQAICAKHQLALIVDEVFLDYALTAPQPSFTTGESPCLTFVLSGISKICGLPQMKVSWIAAVGPSALTDQAMQRLEIIADTFLSLNAPAQLALPLWLDTRHHLQQQIRQRMSSNLAVLDEHLRDTSAQRLALQGGWTTVLRVPRTAHGRPFAVAALERGALIQPGTLYGLGEGRAVLSLLTPPGIWRSGLQRLPLSEMNPAMVIQK